jgi:hypothetical protein
MGKCTCGDALDEHDESGRCLVEGCPCFYPEEVDSDEEDE